MRYAIQCWTAGAIGRPDLSVRRFKDEGESTMAETVIKALCLAALSAAVALASSAAAAQQPTPQSLINAPALVVGYGLLQGDWGLTTIDVERGRKEVERQCLAGGGLQCRIYSHPGGRPACIGMNVPRLPTSRASGSPILVQDETTRDATLSRVHGMCGVFQQCGPKTIVVCNDGQGAIAYPYYQR
jgi:hypothetical protein